MLLLVLAVFWGLLYAYRAHRRRKGPASFLPAPPSSLTSASPLLFASRSTRITLHNLHLSAQLSSFNDIHLSASARLRRSRWKVLVTSAYDAGSILGAVGMVGSLVLLVWASIQLALSLYDQLYAIPPPHTPALHKRDALPEVALPSNSHQAPLTLIIPGVTTPLSDLPVLLVSLLTTQIIHELGHAVAAALESVSLSSVGLGLTVLLPSAFVAFPSGEVDSLPPRPRLRIISAGAFHNLLFWLALVIFSWARIPSALWPMLGYSDVSLYGRVVVSVDESSPLYGHLPRGAVIYKVGDDTLNTGRRAAERWEALLTDRSSLGEHDPPLGWCAEEAWFAAHNASCCTPSHPAIPTQACFAPSSEPAFERCVDPLPFLDSASTPTHRCMTAIDCGHAQLCVRPRSDQELLALTLHVPSWLRGNGDGTGEDGAERTLVWQGDSTEILRDVSVGDWLPRSHMLPIGLPLLFSQLFTYLQTLTLSLYFFNLLPLPFLDGGQLLDALHSWWSAPSSIRSPTAESVPLSELEGGDGARTGRRPQVDPHAHVRKDLRGVVHVCAGALLGICVVLALANAYLDR
ncbi:hypothetical protein OH76DRAFT_1489006 [Lentinus brumalis]|uniref:Endopeptidase S2P n=1 Tax=Lentinus brumalis TaxID=2498619 RepID=A0A371CP71_9APHY|nr:hypothetical protein OH76DRAFT_1489006 [Polyporus brumalis]